MSQHAQQQVAPQSARRARRRRSPLAVVVGLIGELMITAGLFLGLFVVWQIWWTDIEAQAVYREVVAEFEAEAPQVDPTDIIEEDERRYEDAPLVAGGAPGERLGLLRVPQWGEGYRVPVVEFMDPMIGPLDEGSVVRYENSASPGQLGNFTVAGHRQSHGAAFLRVDELAVGDAIIFETADAWYVFSVSEWSIVRPTDTDVIAQNPFDPTAAPTERLFTLTTCHPLFSTRERYIVHATFDYWAPRSAGVPSETLEG